MESGDHFIIAAGLGGEGMRVGLWGKDTVEVERPASHDHFCSCKGDI